jgi:hypothetical protein
VIIALAVVLAAGAAQAQSAQRIGLLLTVSHATQQPGPVDPDSVEIHRRLQEEFRFQSLRVIERRHIDLRLQEVGGMLLPTGKRVSLRPMSLSSTGVLIAVEVPGTLETDVRIPNHQHVVIGLERYQDGKLLLTLQPDY